MKSYPRVSEISLSCTLPGVRFYISSYIKGIIKGKLIYIYVILSYHSIPGFLLLFSSFAYLMWPRNKQCPWTSDSCSSVTCSGDCYFVDTGGISKKLTINTHFPHKLRIKSYQIIPEGIVLKFKNEFQPFVSCLVSRPEIQVSLKFVFDLHK